jgi:ABC-type phosphate transport system substrate-binding protein
VLNIGAEKAFNCKLKVKFYEGSMVVQTSEISLGTIGYWGYDYVRKDIDCKLADSVTRIEVERFWLKTP